MLQEACDALIDNGRRGRANRRHRQPPPQEPVGTCSRASRAGSARTCSASAWTTPAGRSIVVGQSSSSHQCGPAQEDGARACSSRFVMRLLVEEGPRPTTSRAPKRHRRARSARGLGRSRGSHQGPPGPAETAPPTLHRLGIQAFMPILVEGSAISDPPARLHRLSTRTSTATRWRFQRPALHGPPRKKRGTMMLFDPPTSFRRRDGSPGRGPTQDMVSGAAFYLTMEESPSSRARRCASSPARARRSSPIKLREVPPFTSRSWPWSRAWDENLEAAVDTRVQTTVGRIIFNQIVPDRLRFKERGT